MKALKYDVSLAPTMNVLRHPGWGRAQETYGEDPVLVGNMAAAFVRGMQNAKMIACPKHFAVNNTENNRGDGADQPNVNMVVNIRKRCTKTTCATSRSWSKRRTRPA